MEDKNNKKNESKIILTTLSPDTHRTSEENLGLAYLTAVLRKNGYNVEIIDGWLGNLEDNEVLKQIINKKDVSIVGISCYMSNNDKSIEKDGMIMINDENLKTIIEEVVGNEDQYLNTTVYDVMKKIIDLPTETTTTIADLINYNPNETFVEPLTQGQIRRLVKETCKKLNIELEENRDGFGGLAYYYQFKKVDNNRF